MLYESDFIRFQFWALRLYLKMIEVLHIAIYVQTKFSQLITIGMRIENIIKRGYEGSKSECQETIRNPLLLNSGVIRSSHLISFCGHFYVNVLAFLNLTSHSPSFCISNDFNFVPYKESSSLIL